MCQSPADILHVLDDADRVVATVPVEAVGAAEPYRAALEGAGWRVVEFYGGRRPGSPVALVERVVGRCAVREVTAQPASH